MRGCWRWALVSPDGVAPSRMVGVSAFVNLPLHHKVQNFSSGTGSPGWSRKKGCKTVVCCGRLIWLRVSFSIHCVFFYCIICSRLDVSCTVYIQWTAVLSRFVPSPGWMSHKATKPGSIYGRPMEQGRPLYFCPVVTSFFLFFPRLISAVADWMSTILPHMMWP